MQCPKCSKEYDDSFRYCPFCAEVSPLAPLPPPTDAAESETMTGVKKQSSMKKITAGKWTIPIILGIGVLAIIGLVIGLTLGLGGKNSVVGTYATEDGAKTLELSEDGSAVLTFTIMGKDYEIEGKYVVEEERVRIWDPSKGSSEDIEGIVFRRVGNNLVEAEENETYVKQGSSPADHASKSTNQKPSDYDYTPSSTMPTSTEPTWTEVANFSGSGSQNTSSFNINSSAVRIRWNGTAGSIRDNFIIKLRPTTGELKPSLVSVIIEAGQTMSNETFSYDVIPGSYYLEIMGPDSWTISVDQQL